MLTLLKNIDRRWRGLAMCAWVAATSAATAAPAAPVAPVAGGAVITALPLLAGERITLDGRLDHPAWQRAPRFEGFVEKLPHAGGAPAERTGVQVLFDERALYVGVSAYDQRPQDIRDALVRHDFVNRTQDFVVVYLDPIGSRQAAQFFRINSAGSLGDGLHTAADDSEDFSPDFDWDGAVARHDWGWTAVLRLPFASLRFAEGEQGRWRIMVGRRLPRAQFHLMTSVLVPPEASSFIDTLQPLDGVRLPEDHAFLSLRPSATVRRTREPQASARHRRIEVEASLDMKWRPRAELLVDATLQPDFSQVALDVPQLAGNSRFALYFPEKRPFFFESADLLRTPTDALYTRSFTEPRAGLRATWRSQRWAGSAFTIDDRGGGLVLLPGPYGTGAVAQPASQTLALRALQGEGEDRAGAVMAARRYEEGRGENLVLGPDFGIRLGPLWRLRAQWLHSRTTAHDDGRGGLQHGAGRDGDRLFVRLARKGVDSETELELDHSSAGFRHDSGFVNQVGVRNLVAFHGQGWRQLGPLNEFWLNLRAQHMTDARGRVVVQDLAPGFWLSAAHNVEAWLKAHVVAQTRLQADGPLLHQRYVAVGGTVTPARWFPLLEASLDAGRLADAQAARVRPGWRWSAFARLRPLPRLELESNLSGAWLDDQGHRAYEEGALQALAIWHLGPRSHLRAIVQRSRLARLATAGSPAVDERAGNESLTWAWRPSMGTVLYLGATRSRAGHPADEQRSELFLKLQFDVDEARAAWRR